MFSDNVKPKYVTICKFRRRLGMSFSSLIVCLLFHAAEPRVLRIETKQAPRPSQAEVVQSDG